MAAMSGAWLREEIARLAALLQGWARRETRNMTPAETRDEKKIIHAPTLTAAEVRYSIVDEYILLRLDTADEQLWVRLSRENFIGLTEYLNDEVRRIREH